MRIALFVVAAAIAASPLAAQGPGRVSGNRAGARPGGPPTSVARERQRAVRERMQNASPEERKAIAERLRARREAMTPEQREVARGLAGGARERSGGAPTQGQRDFAKALGEKRRQLRADVAAGKLDRSAAADELRMWIKDRRPKPAGDE